ncbi:TIM barrel protein [Thalassoglobus sp. JC818]|uniref:sugar phosphate isomerase/epimerase family protein n=1 Tax=Thalassoglobus sp. JC818 TaxID=3232136 RepID=UPI003457B2B6
MPTTESRRLFLQKLIATSGALACFPGLGFADDSQGPIPDEWPIAIFEKVFEGLNYTELAKAVSETGADGIEATIRPGGHIEPEVAADEVPKMSEALGKQGCRIVIAATAVRSVDEPHTESLLKVLKEAGVTHYRMGHYHLDLAKPMLPQLRNYTAQARDLAAMNQEIGIQGLYQNHSGANRKRGYLGALGWDAAMMLEGISPEALGIAFDTRHLKKDTGSSWWVALATVRDHIRSIYVKDGIWKGPRGDQYEDVPLDMGFVNEEVFSTIRNGLPPMPLCIHMEWMGYRIFTKPEIPSAVKAHQRDIRTLRKWMNFPEA